jgi:shikimate dehydrogenase
MPNKKQWIFDAVYTPAKTNFINKGEQVGAKIISGIDLFIFQAIDAFLYFTENKENNHDLINHIHKLRKHYFDKLYI